MDITKKTDGTKLTVTLDGRLDTTTAPELEKELTLDDVTDLEIDFTALRYISSAGLRVLLGAQKKMNANNGRMVVKNANDMIMDVFEATGFTEILTLEND